MSLTNWPVAPCFIALYNIVNALLIRQGKEMGVHDPLVDADALRANPDFQFYLELTHKMRPEVIDHDAFSKRRVTGIFTTAEASFCELVCGYLSEWVKYFYPEFEHTVTFQNLGNCSKNNGSFAEIAVKQGIYSLCFRFEEHHKPEDFFEFLAELDKRRKIKDLTAGNFEEKRQEAKDAAVAHAVKGAMFVASRVC